MASPVLESCGNHPDRRGFAICMSCRKVVCQECATTWDGVNYCRSCLERRTRAAAARGRARAWIAWAAFCGVLFFVTARVLAWSAAMLARMF
jgi:hypothetical protein